MCEEKKSCCEPEKPKEESQECGSKQAEESQPVAEKGPCEQKE